MKEHIQQIDRTLDWTQLPALTAWTLEQAFAIQQIPAPTFHEAARAGYVAQVMRELGLQQVTIDERFNVYGLLPAQGEPLPGVMISAHTDTVFSADTNLQIRHQSNRVTGPGLGDNSVGVAGMLALARFLKQTALPLRRDVWFVATTGEEGLGDLGGMRMAFDRLQAHVGSVINLEGLAYGHVYRAGICVRRLRINISAPGGHSWLHFGHPSAVHALIALGARITALQPPQEPRTTYNIGLIEGGESINSIAARASLWLDMRSESPEALAELEAQVRAEISALTTREIAFEVEVVGDRPGGALPVDHPLIRAALDALEQIGVSGALESGSTDANIPLSRGCPAVTVGITRGGNAHRLDEFIEIEPIKAGLRQLILLALALATDERGVQTSTTP